MSNDLDLRADIEVELEFEPSLTTAGIGGELGQIYYIHSARLNLGLYRSDVNVV